jgi:hypothetical protein
MAINREIKQKSGKTTHDSKDYKSPRSSATRVSPTAAKKTARLASAATLNSANLAEIFSYLTKGNLAQLSFVSHRFNSVTKKNAAWAGTFLQEFSLYKTPENFPRIPFKKATQEHVEFDKFIAPALLESDSLKNFRDKLTTEQKAAILLDHLPALDQMILSPKDCVSLTKIAAACGAANIVNHFYPKLSAQEYKTIATYSVLSGNLTFIKECIQKANDELNLSRALYFASVRGKVGIYTYLLEKFATAPNPENINTAVSYGHIDLVALMMSRGIGPTSMTFEQAAQNDDEPTYRVLRGISPKK